MFSSRNIINMQVTKNYRKRIKSSEIKHSFVTFSAKKNFKNIHWMIDKAVIKFLALYIIMENAL